MFDDARWGDDPRDRPDDWRDRDDDESVTLGRGLASTTSRDDYSEDDPRDHDGRPADPRSGDLRHLREEGLIRTERMDGHRDVAVVLTKEGRSVLESHRRDHSHEHRHDHRQDRQQAFSAEFKKPPEVRDT